MTREISVEVENVGVFVLAKPKAGPRNKAIIEAGGLETENERIKFLFAVMPHCVKTHPWYKKYKTIRDGLDDMETDQYDKLLKSLGDLLNPDGDAEKKSEPSSGQTASEATTH